MGVLLKVHIPVYRQYYTRQLHMGHRGSSEATTSAAELKLPCLDGCTQSDNDMQTLMPKFMSVGPLAAAGEAVTDARTES